MSDRDAIREAQHNRQRLIEAHAVLAVMNIEKEDDYPGWDRRDKVRFTKRYKALGQYIIELQGWLQDAPPAPLHPAEATAKLIDHFKRVAEPFDGAVDKFIESFRVNPEFAIQARAGEIVGRQYRHVIATAISKVICANDDQGIAGWESAISTVVDYEERERHRQETYSGTRSTSMFSNAIGQANAEARVQALNYGWLSSDRLEIEYFDARVQVWAELKAMEKEATQ